MVTTNFPKPGVLCKIERQETIKQTRKGTTQDQTEKNLDKVAKKTIKSFKDMKKKNQVNEEDMKEIISKVRNMSDEDSDTEDDFWMPPLCASRDIHIGDRRGSDLQLRKEADGVSGAGTFSFAGLYSYFVQ